MSNITKQIYERIEHMESDAVFVASDFTDIADINTVWQVLSRLEQKEKIQRIFRGVYYNPRYSELLGEYEMASPHQVALALARNYGWTIAPSGNTALNQLGLSTQVSEKWSYISDGPYNTFEFNNIQIEFKHRSNKDISGLAPRTALVIQAIRALGKDDITEEDIVKISSILTTEEKEILLKEAKQSTAWIYKFIKKICMGEQNV